MLKLAPSIEQIEKSAQVHHIALWDSKFDFLKATQGIRPACLIGLMGTTGTGKSTLLKAIIADTAQDHPVMVWLTEEPVVQYVAGIKKSKQTTNFENILFFHEDDLGESTKEKVDDLLFYFFEKVVESGCRIVFMDNITTSAFYSSHFGEKGQSRVIDALKKFAHKNKITIFFLIHTAKNVTDNSGKLIMGEDVRGSNKSFITADYFYILQRFEVASKFFTFIRIIKHRYHENVTHKYFILNYIDGHYYSDTKTDFAVINKAFLDRNYLGKR